MGTRALMAWSYRVTVCALTVIFFGAATDTQPTSSPQPAMPLPESAGQTAHDVVRIGADGRLVVRRESGQQVLRLRGVHIPDGIETREAACAFLTRLLEGEAVYVETEPNESTPAADAPLWAYVYRAPDRLFVNLELVRLGFARVAAGDSGTHTPVLREYEELARVRHKGVWRPMNKEAPAPAASRPAATQPAIKPPVARSTPPRGAPHAEVRVYVTAHGRKYHRADCQFARNGATAILLGEAQGQGYTPCSRCKPPE